MISRNRRSQFVVAVALIALAGSPALAQSRPGRTVGAPSNANGDGGRIILYGTPGNCPPTIACGPEARRPPVFVPKPSRCDHWEWVSTEKGKRIRRCLER